MDTLFDYIKDLCESDLDRIIGFVLGLVSINQQLGERPNCPHCGGAAVIKYGHRKGKQRFHSLFLGTGLGKTGFTEVFVGILEDQLSFFSVNWRSRRTSGGIPQSSH